MKILVIQNGICACDFSFLERYGTVIQVGCFLLHTKSCIEWLRGVDCIILSGGSQHLYEIDNYPELNYELGLLELACELRLRVIGICLGFQLLNHYFGNKVVPLDKPIIGHGFVDASSLCTSYKFLADAFSFHYDGVLTNDSADLVVYGRSTSVCGAPEGLIYFIKHNALPVFGVQMHPEASISSIARCLKSNGLCDIATYDDNSYNVMTRSFFDAVLHAK